MSARVKTKYCNCLRENVIPGPTMPDCVFTQPRPLADEN